MEKVVGVPAKPDWCKPSRAGAYIGVEPGSCGAGTLNYGALELGRLGPVCNTSSNSW